MRIFVDNVDSYCGAALCQELQRGGHRLFGTLKGTEGGSVHPGVKRIFSRASFKSLLSQTLTCGAIIYDLHSADQNELEAMIRALKTAELQHPTIFILISSVMVWARTRQESTPPAPEEGEEGGTEEANEGEEEEVEVNLGDEDFEKRLPPPKFSRWKTMETLTTSLASVNNLSSHVVCAGVLYGNGEASLYDLFKASYLCAKTHRIIEPGTNRIPTLHVRDLGRLISRVLSGESSIPPYALAVDQGKNTQSAIVQGVVNGLSDPFVVPMIAPDSALLAESADVMELNLRMKPTPAMMEEDFPWWSKEGLVSNIPIVAAEFCKWRNLRAIKVWVSGPPGGGKSLLSHGLSERYDIPHLKVQDVIRAAQDGTLGEEIANDIEAKIADAAKSAKKDSLPPRLDRDTLTKIYKAHLNSNVCRYRGYVLDGYPRTHADAVALFTKNKEQKEEEEEGQGEGTESKEPVTDLALLPANAIVLEASEGCCREFIQALPQQEVDGTHNSESGFARRTAAYHEAALNETVPAPSEFFQMNRIEVLNLTVDGRSGEDVLMSSMIYVERAGKFFSFLKDENQEIAKRRQQILDEEEAEKAQEEEARETQEALEAEEKKQRVAKEDAQLQRIAAHERSVLETQSLPLRLYLMRYVAPTLSEGLIQVCNSVPDDPIDFLAEYLLAHASDADKAGTKRPTEDPEKAVVVE